jgi:hypothetical protein
MPRGQRKAGAEDSRGVVGVVLGVEDLENNKDGVVEEREDELDGGGDSSIMGSMAVPSVIIGGRMGRRRMTASGLGLGSL